MDKFLPQCSIFSIFSHFTLKGERDEGGWFEYMRFSYYKLVLGDPIVICSAILTYSILHGHNPLRYLDFHLYFS